MIVLQFFKGFNFVYIFWKINNFPSLFNLNIFDFYLKKFFQFQGSHFCFFIEIMKSPFLSFFAFQNFLIILFSFVPAPRILSQIISQPPPPIRVVFLISPWLK